MSPTPMPPMLSPYQNEEESLQIGELTIENRTDRISCYGSIDLTRDKPGLENARALKALLDAVVLALEAEKNLPDQLELKPVETVKNPFG